ncbi:MAG: hypothetical protein JXR63_08965, partial [Spirochaetales bacterium]|nr:hypothetical protein [Spirochaetales bacterium]
KTTTTFLEKMEVINDIMDLARDESGLSIIAFELGKVFYVTNLYYGDVYNVIDDKGIASIFKTYDNIMQSDLWFGFLEKNKDARYLIELAEKKYDEEFKKQVASENVLVQMLQNMVDELPTEKGMKDLLLESKGVLEDMKK